MKAVDREIRASGLIGAGFLFLSFTFAAIAGSPGEHSMLAVWFGGFSLVSAVGALVLAVFSICSYLDSLNEESKREKIEERRERER